MYPKRFSVSFLGRVLIAAAERRRPALGAWGPEAEEALRAAFTAELAEVADRFLEIHEDAAYWTRVEKALLEVCLPRYLAVARDQTALERAGYGLWRGGDLVARATLGVGALVVAILIVRLPFIPVPSSAQAFLYLGALMVPFVPDVQVWVRKRRFQRELEEIVADLRQTDAQLRLYPPMPRLEEPEGLEQDRAPGPRTPEGDR